jgi:hypothetical protein
MKSMQRMKYMKDMKNMQQLNPFYHYPTIRNHST